MAGNVKLVIFDVLGKEINTLLNDYKQAGMYEIEFNGMGLASGIYYYSLSVEGSSENKFSDVKKMVLIK
jgi:hypothetical protein